MRAKPLPVHRDGSNRKDPEHRDLPEQRQPAQKGFESQLLAALSALDPSLPVFVEAESRRIGSVQLTDTMLTMIRTSPCLRIEASTAARVEFLLRDYAKSLRADGREADAAAMEARSLH